MSQSAAKSGDLQICLQNLEQILHFGKLTGQNCPSLFTLLAMASSLMLPAEFWESSALALSSNRNLACEAALSKARDMNLWLCQKDVLHGSFISLHRSCLSNYFLLVSVIGFWKLKSTDTCWQHLDAPMSCPSHFQGSNGCLSYLPASLANRRFSASATASTEKRDSSSATGAACAWSFGVWTLRIFWWGWKGWVLTTSKYNSDQFCLSCKQMQADIGYIWFIYIKIRYNII